MVCGVVNPDTNETDAERLLSVFLSLRLSQVISQTRGNTSKAGIQEAKMSANASHVADCAGIGKTKTVNAQGASDTRNNIMLYAIIEATTATEAALGSQAQFAV